MTSTTHDNDRMILLALTASLIAVLLPHGIHRRNPDSLTICKSNLKNVGTAREMYATDNADLYPDSAARLTPNYLKVIPTCTSSGTDTYSVGFRSASHPDNYTFFCQGPNHVDSGESSPDYPQCNSLQGLVT